MPSTTRWGLSLAVVFLLLGLLAPLSFVFGSWRYLQPQDWAHLTTYVLPEAFQNTLWLLLGVGVGVAGLGISLAWLTTQYEFPGQRFFQWALVLPLAFPGYVLATVYIRLLDYSGPVSTPLREIFGPSFQSVPIRSPLGCMAVLTLALYPYVYLLASRGFAGQGQRAMEAAQVLGLTRLRAFWQAALPMAKPWWLAGLALALMEVLADFGTVSAFNYTTMTTTIYRVWVSHFNQILATQIASLLVLVVLSFLLLREWAQRGLYQGKESGMHRRVLDGVRGWMACLVCGGVWFVAFALPVVQLALWSWKTFAEVIEARYWGFVWNSLLLCTLCAVLVTVLGLALSLAERYLQGPGWRVAIRGATLGYAVPGLVLAVGAMMAVQQFIQFFDPWLQPWWPQWSHWLQGTVGLMVLALSVRFLAVAYQPLQGALHRITPHHEAAARCLGLSPIRMWMRLHLPMLRGGLFTAALLIFVEVMKEMPMTLMMRPFGWDTLAVRVFELTSEGMWEQAALPSLLIVLTGMLPMWLLISQNAQPVSAANSSTTIPTQAV
jgi:iron(III) transport system permease protein